MIRLDVGINSVVGVGFGFGFGVGFQLGEGLALVLALLLSVCDVMVGIGLVWMMLWEALRVVVRERQDRCIDRIGLMVIFIFILAQWWIFRFLFILMPLKEMLFSKGHEVSDCIATASTGV